CASGRRQLYFDYW
nr:immunoglobulin heavy chain junction region [Macaca mulatta]